jgi:acetyl esterase/lipase
MRSLTVKLILQFICLCPVSLLAADNPLTVDEVLGKYAAAVGGKEAWAKVQSRTMTADFELFGSQTEWKVQAKAPNKRRSETELGALGSTVDGFDGTTAWTKNQAGVRSKTGDELVRAKMEAEFNREVRLKELYPDLAAKAVETFGGEDVHVLESKPTPTSTERFSFSAKTGLMVRQQTQFKNQEGADVALEMNYADYREVEGLKYPHLQKLKISAAGQELFSTEFKVKSIKHNEKLEDALFTSPDTKNEKSPAATAAANVTGEWKVTIELGGQSGEPEFSLKQDGEKISGKYKGLFGELDVTGKISGNKVEFGFATDQAKVVYTGTIDSDAMKGTAKYGDDLEGTWSGKKQAVKQEPAKPAAKVQSEYTRTEDVIYGRKYGLAMTMDVFTPKTNANGLGIIFCVSGGWVSSKEAIIPFFSLEFVNRGYTVFMVVHGSQPRFTIPEAIEDMHRAVRFIRANATKYNIDPERLGMTGASAGGHLALMQGTAPRPGNPAAKDPVERESSKVAAVGCFYPPTDFLNYGKEGESALGVGTLKDYKAPFAFQEFDAVSKSFVPVTDNAKRREIGKQISPAYFATNDDAPVRIIHGDADTLVPIQQAELMVARLKDVGVSAELVVKHGKNHGWMEIGEDFAKLAEWFDTQLLAKK